jgi:hypothetical protein
VLVRLGTQGVSPPRAGVLWLRLGAPERVVYGKATAVGFRRLVGGVLERLDAQGCGCAKVSRWEFCLRCWPL